jgi:cellulose synthase/poly-beta-1,6-N-acetylglucosamine synthase-like glycosyltransferase
MLGKANLIRDDGPIRHQRNALGELRVPTFQRKKEHLFTITCLIATIASLALAYWHMFHVATTGAYVEQHPYGQFFQIVAISLLVLAVSYGSIVFLVARYQYFRLKGRSPSGLNDLVSRFLEAESAPPRLCVLIPSYREDLRVLRQTLLSAALAIYGPRRIAVLIDDPPHGSEREMDALREARALVRDIHLRFHEAATHVRAAYSDFIVRTECGRGRPTDSEKEAIAVKYEQAAAFVASLSHFKSPNKPDRAERFLIDHVITPTVERFMHKAQELRDAPARSAQRISVEYRSLLRQLSVELSTFERKRYANLSHSANKAMNLNSYISLLGRSFTEHRIGDKLFLAAASSSEADLIVPDTTYLLTLDADSLVLPRYVLTLIDRMEADDRIAVAQTPYSHIPGDATALERAAGAQTDLQYIVHQGTGALDAGHWVGANALIRLGALRDIVTMRSEGDLEIPVYIQDKTVIEDTGSTIDLVRKGWKVSNHPERLAYSATPPDFGALIIQRRRWSNGGLIIFPDLLRYAFSRSGRKPRLSETLLRAHYLCGPALVGFSALLLLLFPFDGSLLSGWLPATVVPYYLLYARDARALGYRWKELLHVYVLNWVLLPVTLAGVLQSIRQIITGRKSPFGRTPKIEAHTLIPPVHVLLQGALIAATASIAIRDAVAGYPMLTTYWTLNLLVIVIGFQSLIGFRAAWTDLSSQLMSAKARSREATGNAGGRNTYASKAEATSPYPAVEGRQTQPLRSGRS